MSGFFAAQLMRFRGGKPKPPRSPSHWNRSNCLGVAKASCAYCYGTGMWTGRRGRERPCNCVFRGVFRACFNRYRECAYAAASGQISPVTLQHCHGRTGKRHYSRKREEFMADFFLVSRRVLSEEQFKLFHLHFVLGEDWKVCCRELRLERGNFFHHVYLIEQLCGRTFAELEPYALYPLDEYFSGIAHEQPAIPASTFFSLRRVLAA